MTASGGPPHVEAFYQSAMYLLVKGMVSTKNPRNARDFFHLIVPAASCDVIVLDKDSAERGRQVQAEFERKKLQAHTARIERRIDTFLLSLDEV